MKNMKLANIGGIVLFYSVIILGVLFLSSGNTSLDSTKSNNYDNNLIAMNE